MTSIDTSFDVVVVGAGPAGMAAATEAAHRGSRVAVLDAGARLGGQYWRYPPGSVSLARRARPQHNQKAFRRLNNRLYQQQHRQAVVWLARHHVWALERTSEGRFRAHAIDYSRAGEEHRVILGDRIILAPGAYDRQVPFPGWDLPGVMTAGGAQSLVKGNGTCLRGRRAVVAGTGPFLLPVAVTLAAAGAHVIRVHEANTPTRWLREHRAILRNPKKLAEGLNYGIALGRRRIPLATGSVVISASGAEALSSVTTARIDPRGHTDPATKETVGADLLAVGWGFTPQLELPLALGCDTQEDADGSLICRVDDAQQTSVEGVYVAGEACGVGGAELAMTEGAIAGMTAAGAKVPPSRSLRARRDALRAFAAAMHRAHPLPDFWLPRLAMDTVICRCEEVTVGQLREVVNRFGATDPRSAKLLSRAGMGWCQSRVCGYPTARLLAAWSGSPYTPRTVAERPLAVPVSLAMLTRDPDTSGPHTH